MMIEKQQGMQKEKEGRVSKRAREETRQEAEKTRPGTVEKIKSKVETNQELRTREQDMEGKIMEQKAEMAKKTGKRKREEEVRGNDKKQRKEVEEEKIGSSFLLVEN